MYSKHDAAFGVETVTVISNSMKQDQYRKVVQFEAGFTLIELMIVVVIVSILASVAIPSYRDYMLRSYRADVQQRILFLAHTLERRNTVNASFDLDGTPPVVTVPPAEVIPQNATGGDVRYTIRVAVAPTTYTITATPENDQLLDRCGTLAVNAAGTRTSTGGHAPVLPNAQCWGG
jgi:type IV pilus assembly protein PilE